MSIEDFDVNNLGNSSNLSFIGYTEATRANPDFQNIYNNWRVYYEAYRNRYSNRILNEEIESVIPLSYMKLIIDTETSFIFGESGPKVIVKSEDTEAAKIVQKELDRALKINNWANFCGKAGTFSLVMGDTFSNVGWREVDPETDGFIMKQFGITDFGYPVMQILDNLVTFPISDEDNINRIITYILAKKAKYDEAPKIIEFITRKSYKQYRYGNFTSPYISMENPIIGDFTITHLGNRQGPQSFYGISEIEDVFPMAKELVAKVHSFNNTIDFVGNPTAIVKGAKKKGNMVIGPGKVWHGLDKDASVEYLEYKGSLEYIFRFIKEMEDKYFMIAGIPEIARGKVTSISNVSGTALKVLYQPLVIKAMLKRPEIDRFLYDTLWKVLIFMETKGLIDIPEDLEVSLEYPDPFPKDTSALLDEIERRAALGLITRRQAAELIDMIPEDLEEIIAKFGEELEAVSTRRPTNSDDRTDLSKELDTPDNLPQQQNK